MHELAFTTEIGQFASATSLQTSIASRRSDAQMPVRPERLILTLASYYLALIDCSTRLCRVRNHNFNMISILGISTNENFGATAARPLSHVGAR